VLEWLLEVAKEDAINVLVAVQDIEKFHVNDGMATIKDHRNGRQHLKRRLEKAARNCKTITRFAQFLKAGLAKENVVRRI